MGIRTMNRPAIFLDRDGVLNSMVLNPATGRMESPLTPADFQLFHGVMPALRRLQKAGYLLILASNQPNYALGKTSYETHKTIHQALVNALVFAEIHFVRFSYCLHHPRGLTPGYSHACECRKPSPGLLLQARDDFSLTLADSWMIGDQPTDTQCGRAAGTRTIRIVGSGSGVRSVVDAPDSCADHFARDLTEAVDVILGAAARQATHTPSLSHDAGVDLVPHGPRIVMKHLHGLQRILL
jgi:D-glycero-D-manno-heptose 1,7-bisphosphate phosphatase